jgi:fatty-acyl-CoA synthase
MDPVIRRQSLGDILHRSAARAPHKLAVLCGGVRWTYAELDDLCSRLAAGLAGRGVAKGTRVAVLARNSHAFVALRFALARLGAVLVPINFMLKPDEVAYILRHAGAVLLATDSGLAPVARVAAALDTSVREFVWLPSEDPGEPEPDMTTFDALAATRSGPLPQLELALGDLAQIVYTSGTESSPKGAMLTHDAVLWQYVSCVSTRASRAATCRCTRCRFTTAPSSTSSSARRSMSAAPTSSLASQCPRTCCR